DRETFEDLAVGILQQIGPVAVQHTRPAAGETGAVLHALVHALATGFDADDADGRVVEEGEEETHRVRPTADGGNDGIGKAALALLFRQLPAHLLADDRL